MNKKDYFQQIQEGFKQFEKMDSYNSESSHINSNSEIEKIISNNNNYNKNIGFMSSRKEVEDSINRRINYLEQTFNEILVLPLNGDIFQKVLFNIRLLLIS